MTHLYKVEWIIANIVRLVLAIFSPQIWKLQTPSTNENCWILRTVIKWLLHSIKPRNKFNDNTFVCADTKKKLRRVKYVVVKNVFKTLINALGSNNFQFASDILFFLYFFCVFNVNNLLCLKGYSSFCVLCWTYLWLFKYFHSSIPFDSVFCHLSINISAAKTFQCRCLKYWNFFLCSL